MITQKNVSYALRNMSGIQQMDDSCARSTLGRMLKMVGRKSDAQKIQELLNLGDGAMAKRNEKIKELILELQLQKKRVAVLEDLADFHRDRISALESSNHSILLELNAKSLELLNFKDLEAKKKSKDKSTKKSDTSKKISKTKDLSKKRKSSKKKA